MPKYSVLMSLYSKEIPEFLSQSIDSMLNQTVVPDEIIIVKDGPITQELENALNGYIDQYAQLFKIVESKENIGLGKALNLGLQSCKNELVARMDTDDISFPNRCELQLARFSENEQLDICGTFVNEFISDPYITESIRKVPATHDEIYQFAKRRSPFNHPTVMYKKSKVLSVGGYSDLRRNQDVDLFGRMLFAGSIAANIESSLLYFRANNALIKRRKNWENAKLYIKVIRNFRKMGFSKRQDVFIVTMGQIIVYLSPAFVQRWIYEKILRK